MSRTSIHLVLLTLLILRSHEARSQTLTFPDVWAKVSQSSPALEGAHFKIQAADEGLARAERHWLPRAYLDARSYRTNDPSSAFFGTLEQRKVGSQDFAPDALNHPDAQTFTRGALGVDIALFEGGAKRAQVAMYKHSVTAERYGNSQIEIEQYSQSGMAYESIAILRKQKVKLRELGTDLSRLMKSYQLGQKANPVGYSGLLGMRSVANRINGLIEQMDATERASFSALKELGIKVENWAPQELDPRSFVDRFFPIAPRSTDAGSYKTLAGTEGVRASEEAAKMERARYLPKIGAFGESYVFNGSRDTSNGYSAGLYLQWNLFDPSDYGSYKEAKLKAMASERFNQAASEQENAERSALQDSLRALKANLARLDESDSLLAEQTQVSSTLFKNGSMTALQFVEILNRRTDLINQQTEAQLALLRASAALASKSKFEIPRSLGSGGVK